MMFSRFFRGVGAVLLVAGWAGLTAVRAEEGSGYPLVPFAGVRIGMPEEEVLALDKGVTLASPQGSDKGVALLKRDGMAMLFFLEDGQVVQVNYGWEGRSEKELRERTRTLLAEFSKRYGEGFKAMEPRVRNGSALMVGVRKFPLDDGMTALVESHGGRVLVSVASTRRLAWMVESGSAMAGLLGSAAETEELEDGERPGLFGFGPKRKSGVKGAATGKDFLMELDWQE